MLSDNIHIGSDGTVHLVLPDKKYKGHRILGRIQGNTFRCQRIPEKHIYRKIKGYGFNYDLMKYGTFKFVVVDIPFSEPLVTTRIHILQKGKLLGFIKNNLELQIFLPIPEFGIKTSSEEQFNKPLSPTVSTTIEFSFGTDNNSQVTYDHKKAS